MNYYVYETDDDIVLRSADIDDAQRIADYFCCNRTHLKQWEPERKEDVFHKMGWEPRLTKLHELHRLSLGFYLLIISRETGEMLGTISFSQLVRFPCFSCFVGYSLAQSAQGQGLMTRALTMACHYMFEHQHMHRIVATYMPRNRRSEAVLERVGFVKEGLAEKYLLIDGKWEDHTMTALINPNWSTPDV